MGLTLEQYLLDKYQPNLTVQEIAQICSLLGLAPTCMSWPEESVLGIADIMVGNKLKQKQDPPKTIQEPSFQPKAPIFEEEESVFDYDHLEKAGLPQSQAVAARNTETVLKDIASVISDSTLFKVLCNKLFKFLEAFLADSNNPINQFIAILPEDYGQSLGVVCLLDELCSLNSLKFENKLPKGILIKI